LHLVKVFTISGYVTSATKDVKMFESRFSIIDVVIWCLFMSGGDERSIMGVTCGCYRFNPKEESACLEVKSIVRAASTRVWFRLSTTLFYWGVRAIDV
nr:hypothetical protein [Tanacetum cinerariifolium]